MRPFDFSQSKILLAKYGKRVHILKALMDLRDSDTVHPDDRAVYERTIAYIKALEIRVQMTDPRPEPTSLVVNVTATGPSSVKGIATEVLARVRNFRGGHK